MPRFKNVNGETIQLTADEETARDAEEQAWADGADARAAAKVREKRDELLAATDWMANSDVTLADNWKTYRQALRDITSQAGFPNSVTYPTEPS
jgi:transposase|tara:strand:- start:558 stop:839 length:282 start_codon:yes stop_codon:yes gene_type:complete